LVVTLAAWARLLAWDAVAKLNGFAWGTVRAAVSAAVNYGLMQRDLSNVTVLGIDEISRSRGHIYHTQVYDLTSKRLLWSGEGRKEETLRRFFAECTTLQPEVIIAVCCDMWQPYVNVISTVLPQATIVFDKFHLVRHLLDAVNNVRKAEARELRATNPDLLEGTRYLWLKNPWNLKRHQRARLHELEWYNLKINRAYLLKELFRHVWDFTTRKRAKRYLDSWFWWATHSRLKPIRDFAWLVRRHEDGIMARFDTPIDIGAVEAMNNNAKSIAHRAHGYRTEKTFTLAMLHSLGKLPLPPTTHRFL
jgi:transposase